MQGESRGIAREIEHVKGEKKKELELERKERKKISFVIKKQVGQDFLSVCAWEQLSPLESLELNSPLKSEVV